MAQPSSRKELVDYCLRKLGYPVLEINLAEEQIDDLVDDTLQLFQERHFDGVYQTYLKYQITQADIDRGRAKAITGVGMAVTTASSNIAGIGTVNFNYFENSNYIQMPNHVIGVNKIFKFEGSNSISSAGNTVTTTATREKKSLSVAEISVPVDVSLPSASILIISGIRSLFLCK